MLPQVQQQPELLGLTLEALELSQARLQRVRSSSHVRRGGRALGERVRRDDVVTVGHKALECFQDGLALVPLLCLR